MGSQPICLASEQSSDRVLGTVGQKWGGLDTCPQREGETAVGEAGMEVGLSVPTAGSAVVEVSGRPPLNRRSEGSGGGPGWVPRPHVQERDPWVSALESRQPPWAPLGGRCPWRVQRWGARPPPPPGQRGPQCTGVWGGAPGPLPRQDSMTPSALRSRGAPGLLPHQDSMASSALWSGGPPGPLPHQDSLAPSALGSGGAPGPPPPGQHGP